MLAGCQRMVATAPWTSTYYGPSSELSFIMRTLELFRITHHDMAETLNTLTGMFDVVPLFDGFSHSQADKASEIFRAERRDSTPTDSHEPSLAPDLPDLPEQTLTGELIDALFGRSHSFLNFLHEGHFKVMVHQVYARNQLDHNALQRVYPLLLQAIALGFLYCRSHHQLRGCNESLGEAVKYHMEAQKLLDMTKCDDLVAIQALLCSIVFLMSTSNLAAAHSLTGLAYSSALRLGLNQVDLGGGVTDEHRMKITIFATIVKIDILICLLIDIPSMVPESLVQSCLADLHRIADRVGATGMELEVFTKHLELLRFTYTARQSVFSGKESSSEDFIDTKALFLVEKELHGWTEDVSDLLSRLQDRQDLAM
jgi:hypothetical protein